jgi:hypothetical protein
MPFLNDLYNSIKIRKFLGKNLAFKSFAKHFFLKKGKIILLFFDIIKRFRINEAIDYEK